MAMPTSSTTINLADIDNNSVSMNVIRYDIAANCPPMDVLPGQLLEEIRHHWVARYELNYNQLVGRDPDRDWVWEQTLVPEVFTLPGTVDRVDASVLVVSSGRSERPEAIATIMYGWLSSLVPQQQARLYRRTKRILTTAYIDAIATAPWNRADIRPPTRIPGLGQLMLVTSMRLSAAKGLEHRVAFHAAELAEAWYNTMLPDALKEQSGPEMSYAMYYEIPTAVAKSFCNARPLMAEHAEYIVTSQQPSN